MVLLFFREASCFSYNSSVSCPQTQVHSFNVSSKSFPNQVPFLGQHFSKSRPVIGAEALYFKLLQLPVEPFDRVLAAVAPAPGQHLARLRRVGVEKPLFAPLSLFYKRPHLVYLY